MTSREPARAQHAGSPTRPEALRGERWFRGHDISGLVHRASIDLDIPAGELRGRLERLTPRAPKYRRGCGALYLEHVQGADQGCDFDFLRARPGERFAPASPAGS